MSDERLILLQLATTREPEDVQVFIDYFADTNGPRLSIAVYFFSAFASALVLLRLYARLVHNPTTSRRLRPDDWWIIAAWLCYLVTLVFATIQFKSYGLGDGIGGVFAKGKPTELLETLYFGALFYLMTMSFSKFSILSLYWMVLGSLDHVRPYLLGCTWFLASGTVGMLGWSLFSCVPVNQQFDIRLINNKCRLLTMHELLGVFVFTTITDIMLMLLSIPLLKTLRLPRHEKVGIFSMFALTLVTIAASMARTIVMVKNQDLTELVVWGFVESSLCVVVACIPALRAMAAKFKRKVIGSRKLEDEEDMSELTFSNSSL